MLNHIKSIFIAITLVVVLPACQTTPTSFNPRVSEALQIMRVEGGDEGLKDVTKEELDRALGTKGDDSLVELGMAAGHAGGFLKAPTGLSNLSAAKFHLLTLFTTPSFQAGEVSRLMVWMPETLAEDEKDAQLKLAKIVETAVVQALPRGYSTRIQEWTDTAVFGAKTPIRVIRVDGENCEDFSCVIKGYFPSKGRFPAPGRMSNTDTPFFLGGETKSSYRFYRYYHVLISKIVDEYDEKGNGAGQWHRMKTELVKGFDYLNWYTRISELLPAWAYYYHAPVLRKPELTVFPYPVILNQGKPLYFVEPTQ